MNDQTIYKSASDTTRIAILEGTTQVHSKEIEEIKRTHKDSTTVLFNKIDGIQGEVHLLAVSIKDMVINQIKAQNKVVNGLFLVGLGFILQIIAGVAIVVFTR